MRVACLFVELTGPYSKFDVDLWPISRDARLYSDSLPIVAHPPCERWGRYWGGGPRHHGKSTQRTLGDDGRCFESALRSVRRCGGVIEHPEGSHAWAHFGLDKPPKSGGWIRVDETCGDLGGWSCCVEQGHYGHSARKATWLYVAGITYSGLPELVWGPSKGTRLDEGFHSQEERRLARAIGQRPIKRLSRQERLWTPERFAEVLIDLASQCRAVRR